MLQSVVHTGGMKHYHKRGVRRGQAMTPGGVLFIFQFRFPNFPTLEMANDKKRFGTSASKIRRVFRELDFGKRGGKIGKKGRKSSREHRP